MQTVSNSPAQDKAKELRASIDSQLDTLARAVDEVRASEMFQDFLKFQARFHSYSWHNSWLILLQRPTAARVAGFKTWQSMGRQVRKGERGIMIFAPRPWTKEKEDGETESGIFFRPVYVFDVAQTGGEALPEVDCPNIVADASGLLSRLERVTLQRGLTLQTDNTVDFGYATSAGVIALNDTHATGQRAKTLAHELAHAAMHFDKSVRAELNIDRNKAELEAESVAYVVCTHFGLDCAVRCSRYIAIWQGDSKALKASLERIATTARAIIDEVEAMDSAAGESAVAA